MGALESDERLVDIAKNWVIDEYSRYPIGIEDFSHRDFTPTPTVVLEEKLDVQLFVDTVEDAGYYTKVKRSRSGKRLIAVCKESPAEHNTDIRYVFDEAREISLDSPRQHDEMPEDGRTALIVEYLHRKYS